MLYGLKELFQGTALPCGWQIWTGYRQEKDWLLGAFKSQQLAVYALVLLKQEIIYLSPAITVLKFGAYLPRV